MYCVQNRSCCHDCDRCYLDSNCSNHLISQGHIDNNIKKRSCSCNFDITRNKLCCTSKLSHKSDFNTQTDFSDKQDISRKQTTKYKNIHLKLLYDNLRENLGKLDKTESDNIMVKIIIDDFLKTKCIPQNSIKLFVKIITFACHKN